MRHYKIAALTILTLIMVLTVTVLTGCSGQANPETKNILKVGFSTPYTGAAAEKGAPIAQGGLDAW